MPRPKGATNSTHKREFVSLWSIASNTSHPLSCLPRPTGKRRLSFPVLRVSGAQLPARCSSYARHTGIKTLVSPPSDRLPAAGCGISMLARLDHTLCGLLRCCCGCCCFAAAVIVEDLTNVTSTSLPRPGTPTRFQSERQTSRGK